MKFIRTISNIMLMCIMLSACETPLTNIPLSKLPQAESKLVVSSIISPELPYINVIVTESIPLFTETYATGKRVEDAVVRISDGVNEITIPFDEQNKLYSLPQSEFPIKDLTTYYLSVSDKTRNATAKCTVPGKRPVVKSYEFDTLIVDNIIMKDTVLTVRMSWQDVSGDTNYYKADAAVDLQYSVAERTEKNEIQEKILKDQFHFYWQGQDGKTEFISDKHLDGSIMHSLFGKFNLFSPTQLVMTDGKKVTYYPKNKVLGLLLQVSNIDVNYYKHLRSLETTQNSGTPFAEPAPLYSNIQGGLGCFAAYNASQVKVAFPKR